MTTAVEIVPAMARPTDPRRIEAAFERLVERPFLRRAGVSLPLLRGSLRRAMEDELKAVVPSRYTITVSSSQLRSIDAAREEWEVDLTSYFLQLLRENGWSAFGPPRVTIAYDPALTGDEVRVAVEEPGIIYNGGPLRAQRRGSQMVAALTFVALLVFGGLVIAGILRPELLDGLRPSPPELSGPAQPLVLPWDFANGQPGSW